MDKPRLAIRPNFHYRRPMFDLIGVSPAKAFNLPQINSPLSWLNNTLSLRKDLKQLLSWTKSVIIVALLYNNDTDSELMHHPDYMSISKYAVIRDYHKIIPKRLKALINQGIIPNLSPILQKRFKYKIHTDSYPIYEKGYAISALGGIIGKNNLWHSASGTFVFIGGFISNISASTIAKIIYEPDFYKSFVYQDISSNFAQNTMPHTMCKTCNNCVINCPTHALTPNFKISKCINFWSNEYKGVIPRAIQTRMKNILYGCDICQNTCPFNKLKAPILTRLQLIERFGKALPRVWHISQLKHFSVQGFYKTFAGTPVIRMRFKKFKNRIDFYIRTRTGYN